MADLSDDQIARITAAEADTPKGVLALLDENDRLQEENTEASKAMAKARRQAKDAMDRRDIEAVAAHETAHRLATLIETVRGVAESLALAAASPAAVALAAATLHTACNRAEGSDRG